MIVCKHGIAGHCPICATDRRAEIAERELRETAEELERVRVRLEEATGLLRSLEQCVCWSDTMQAYTLYQRVRDVLGPVRAFLSGATARERTNALLCFEGDCAKMTGRARPCPIHDEGPAAPRTPVLRPEFVALGEALGMGRPAQASEDRELSRISELEHELQAAEAAADAAGCEWRKAEAKLAAVHEWTLQHGKALVPHGGWADTYGDGMRCAKQQVGTLLRTPAPATGETPMRCPRCESTHPRLHPAMQEGGEVQPCPDPWHKLQIPGLLCEYPAAGEEGTDG